MRKVYLLLVLFSLQVAVAQSADSTATALMDSLNKVDDLGKKQGYWIITNEMVNGKCDDDFLKVKEGTYKNSRKNGKWKEYYCSSAIKSEITYVNNRPRGYAKIYHENGNVLEEGNWVNNRWTGVYKLYYENGQVQQEFNFSAIGKREGKQVYYYANGQVMIEGNWENGKESGIVTDYYENGDVKKVRDFSGGVLDTSTVQVFEAKEPIVEQPVQGIEEAPAVYAKPDEEKGNIARAKFDGNGQHTLYNSNLQMTKEGVFKNYRLMDGRAFEYNEDGILVRILIYKRGKYIGDGLMEEEGSR